MADKPYSRIYHSIVDDPKFATIYGDDRKLATWLRLLICADQTYPASAPIPAGTNRSALAALVDVGLVDLGTASRYRIHGLASEREMRSESARNAAAVRWQSARRVPTNATAMLDETRRDETSKDEQNARDEERWDAPETEAIQWLARHGCDVRGGFRQQLITATEVHGSDAMIGMFDRLAAGGTKQGDIKGFLFGAIDALNAKSRPNLRTVEREDAAERQAESARLRVERTKRHLHEIGHHQDEADPLCPACVEVGAAR
jgi:hypothetical protein